MQGGFGAGDFVDRLAQTDESAVSVDANQQQTRVFAPLQASMRVIFIAESHRYTEANASM